ncbi:MAG: hypothetical protein M1374_04990 [Firmicutes bacterium]|nr:hypothetical protein [Bacillota bacterium]
MEQTASFVEVEGVSKRILSKRVVEHVGTARTESDLAVLISKANELIAEKERAGQMIFPFDGKFARSTD